MENTENEAGFVWTARRLRPVTLVYVMAVFLGFMALAHFVFHSPDAVKALLLGCVGAMVPMAPGLSRMEYRASASGLEKRPFRRDPGDEKEFEQVFSWDELSRMMPTREGFKYYKKLHEPNRLKRFWKLHILSGYSGEFQVEEADRESVEALFSREMQLRSRTLRSGEKGDSS